MSGRRTLTPIPSPWKGEGSFVALCANFEWEAA